MHKFDLYFDIIDITGKAMTVSEALSLADREIKDLVYDELGQGDDTSWYFVEAVLSNLKQYDEIKDYTILKESDIKPVLSDDKNVVY